MSSIGKFTNSLIAAHNENTLALVNLNFDFSLYRYDAPPEFRALGANISDIRRREAEGGAPHKTARRLGALFEGVLPLVPELSRAYGRRVSEISQSWPQNPTANAGGGPFSEHMGADGTAIWAAATSRAIPILLLGCMLARIWPGPEATSLWVELVDRRRREIEKICTDDSPSHFALLQAAHQDIERSHLADWDASTRAWLQTADEVKQLQQTQLMVIVNNLQLPVSNNMNVYQSILESAKSALLSMESLLTGTAQRVQEGAFLLGLSAWHIYPDMVVHGSMIQEIKQNDSLVPVGSIVILGLEASTESHSGVYWSLPLAHLRYYGDPIQKSRSTRYDASRVSTDELMYIALGALFNGWFETSAESAKGLQWLCSLSSFFERASQFRTANFQGPNIRQTQRQLFEHGWLGRFMSAAVAISRLQPGDKQRADKLIALGYRRYRNFLEKGPSHRALAFGLLKPANLFPLLETDEERIALLRNFAERERLDGRQYIIRYKPAHIKKVSFTCLHSSASYAENLNKSHFEFATAYPLSPKGHHPQDPACTPERQPRRQMRWIALSWNHDPINNRHMKKGESLEILRGKDFAVCRCADGCSSKCICTDFADGCHNECSCHDEAGMCASNLFLGHAVKDFKQRISSIEALGELCVDEYPRSFLDHCRLHAKVRMNTDSKQFAKISAFSTSSDYTQQAISMRNMSREFYDDIKRFYRAMWNGKAQVIRHLRNAPWETQNEDGESPVGLDVRYGDPASAALYYVSKSPVPIQAEPKSQSLSEAEVRQLLEEKAIDAHALALYMANLHEEEQGYKDCVVSLKALASLITLFDDIPGATIAMDLAANPLHDSKFVGRHLTYPGRTETETRSLRNRSFKLPAEHSQKKAQKSTISDLNTWMFDLDLASKFACIALCEFAAHDIDPGLLEHVFAVSSRNSIFVAAPLLDDPAEYNKHDTKVRRVVGNIGRAGIAMMISPPAPKIRPLEPDQWEQINHAPFDGNPTDSFHETSLHLSFTQYKMPLNTGTHGAQDAETFLIETLVSVHDREKWVADVDVLGLFRSKLLHRYQRKCERTKQERSYADLIAIDNWEELLDREKVNSVVRAHENPKARLATAIISVTQGCHTVVVAGNVCWSCMLKQFDKQTTYIQ